MQIYEKSIKLPRLKRQNQFFDNFMRAVHAHLDLAANEIVIRFVITKSDAEFYYVELGILQINDGLALTAPESIFTFKPRQHSPGEAFNAILMVPTGIGAEIGGHAGDAGPVAKLLASACDTLITHPNVVNASDINELPANGLYVEGSSLCRLLMGTIGLRKVHSNRLLLIVDQVADQTCVHESINALNAARATYGLNCPLIVTIDPPLEMTLVNTESGRASGILKGLEVICEVLEQYKNQFDAIAFSTAIQFSPDLFQTYYKDEGHTINPWGGIEALLTHAVSLLYNLPSAHSPMAELDMEDSRGLITEPLDPRLAGEWISRTFLQCILKGLQTSPHIVTDTQQFSASDVISASDIACLVIPDHVLGLPVLAALEQGIPVIAVKENRNIMQNDLLSLPWQPGKFFHAENYWEAAGILSALKAGIAPETVRRPLHKATVITHKHHKN